MASSTNNNEDELDNESLLYSILSSGGGSESDSNNFFDCFSIPLRLHQPSEIRKSFLTLSRKVHPDKNSHHLAKEAFQILSTAFETLYNEQSQRKHLQDVLVRKQMEMQEKQKKKKKTTTSFAASTNSSNKKRKKSHHEDWKQQWEEKKKKKTAEAESSSSASSAWKRWEDVVADMKRREQLEREFVRLKSDERLEKKLKGLVWKAMKICRNLDEKAGCPPTFVNGLWAPLYEQEVLKQHSQQAKSLPEGWERIYRRDEGITLYRNIRTGKESETHPNPEIQALLEKSRLAERTNQYRFQNQTRQFLDEIIDYLHEDHDYYDMDDDIKELIEEEEGARNNNNNNNKETREYDY